MWTGEFHSEQTMFQGRARASGCAAAMVGSMSWVSWRHLGAWWSQRKEVGDLLPGMLGILGV